MGLEKVTSTVVEAARVAAYYCFGADRRSDEISIYDAALNPDSLPGPVEGKDILVLDRYNPGWSPLRNDFNKMGATFGLGYFAGLGRIGFGSVKFALGAASTVLVGTLWLVAAGVQFIAEKVFRITLSQEGRFWRLKEGLADAVVSSFVFGFDGGVHALRGGVEAATLGLHCKIVKLIYKQRVRSELKDLGEFETRESFLSDRERLLLSVLRSEDVMRSTYLLTKVEGVRELKAESLISDFWTEVSLDVQWIASKILRKYRRTKAYAFKAYANQHTRLYYDMHRWGQKPIVGLFTGTARATYGALKVGLGAAGLILSATVVALAGGVECVARKVLGKPGQRIDVKGCLKTTAHFTLDGLYHLCLGVVEALTLGCIRLFQRPYYTIKVRCVDEGVLCEMSSPYNKTNPEARRSAIRELKRRQPSESLEVIY